MAPKMFKRFRPPRAVFGASFIVFRRFVFFVFVLFLSNFSEPGLNRPAGWPAGRPAGRPDPPRTATPSQETWHATLCSPHATFEQTQDMPLSS